MAGDDPSIQKAAEIATQLDDALSSNAQETEHIRSLITSLVPLANSTKDLIFDLVSPLMRAASLSKACEDAVIALLQATSTSPATSHRDLYTAIAEAISTCTFCGNHNTPPQSYGLSPLSFHHSLFSILAQCVASIHRRFLSYVDLLFILIIQWSEWAIEQHPTIPNSIEDDVFCNAVRILLTPKHHPNTKKNEEESMKDIICKKALHYTTLSAQHPWLLSEYEDRMAGVAVAAQASLTNKLAKYEPVLLDYLQHGPGSVVQVAFFGVSNSNTYHESIIDGMLDVNVVEGVGAAVAACCSIFSSSASLSERGSGRQVHRALKMLQILTDASSMHQSVVLALLPLSTLVSLFTNTNITCTTATTTTDIAEQQCSMQTNVECLLSTLIMSVTVHPVEAVRTAAYEAVHVVLDAMDEQLRMGVLKELILGVKYRENATVAAIALQRVRQELSVPTSLSLSSSRLFTRRTALRMAREYLKDVARYDVGGEYAENVEALAAAVSVVRFVLLQLVAGGTNDVFDTRDELEALAFSDFKSSLGPGIEGWKKAYGGGTGRGGVVGRDEATSDLSVQAQLAVDRLHDAYMQTLQTGSELIYELFDRA